MIGVVRWWFVFVAVISAFSASDERAFAQAGEPPVILVVESGNTRDDAARFRVAMQRELGTPVLSVLEAMNRSTAGMVSVALTENGRRAAIGFLPSDGTRFAVLVEVRATSRTDANSEWLVAPCLAAVRTSMQRRLAAQATPEVLDPWLASRVLGDSSAPREAIDPWVGEPRPRVRVTVDDYYLGDDIIDPWAEVVSQYQAEQARRLTRPRRGGTTTPRPPAPAPTPAMR